MFNAYSFFNFTFNTKLTSFQGILKRNPIVLLPLMKVKRGSEGVWRGSGIRKPQRHTADRQQHSALTSPDAGGWLVMVTQLSRRILTVSLQQKEEGQQRLVNRSKYRQNQSHLCVTHLLCLRSGSASSEGPDLCGLRRRVLQRPC